MTAAEMRGAWAGEIGHTQFLPSSYLKYAVDYDGNGRRDLIHSAADAVAGNASRTQRTEDRRRRTDKAVMRCSFPSPSISRFII